MVGFSLAHGRGALLFFFPVLLSAWVIFVAPLSLFQAVKKRRVTWRRWAFLGLGVAVICVLSIPYSFWQWAFDSRVARSPQAAEFLVFAAAMGNQRTVEGLIPNGVAVDATDREGKTALHAAAAGGQEKVIEYLVSKNCNLNAVDCFGDSPLQMAISEHHEEAARFLADHGAKRIQGSEEQRQRAAREIVEKEIQRLNRADK
jgi:signal transduction histidine kinase